MSFGTVQAEKMTTESGYSLGAGNASSFKNRIINGRMEIDQRNSGASVTSASGGGVYPVDRWEQESATGGGVFTMQQSSTAPANFSNSILYTVTTADTSLAAGDRYVTRQIIEGYNIADFGFGTASAKTVTVSFWVRSSLTGTYCIALRNGSNARSYVVNYTIDAANTWEQKTVNITGDTGGTWGTTNGRGIQFTFCLGAGANAQTTANTWSGGLYDCTSSQVNWLGTVGNTFYITGVQLEVGTVATSFDFRSIGTELSLCQRYFESSNAEGVLAYIPFACYTATDLYGTWFYRVTKRTTPTVTILQTGWNAYSNGGTKTVSSVTNDGIGINNVCIDIIGSGWSAGNSAFARNTSVNAITVSAEL